MSAKVRDSYDAIAELYASFNLDALDPDTNARDWLAAFATVAAPRRGQSLTLDAVLATSFIICASSI